MGRVMAGRCQVSAVPLYAWQRECLGLAGVLSGAKNLVYTAPTSSGKTLVAHTIIVEHLKRAPFKKALVVLPYVAMCEDQTLTLREMLGSAVPRARVRTAYGGERSRALLAQSTGVIVATAESAWSLVLRMMALGTPLDEVFGCVFADEVHMIGEGGRGHALEMLLTLFRSRADTVHLVCASATLGNCGEVARWLGATEYAGTERPVPLHHHVVSLDGTVHALDEASGCWLPERRLGGSAFLTELVGEIVARDYQSGGVLVFCSSKNECVATARMLAAAFPGTGVAYHHADVSTDEKRRLEAAFSGGSLRVLTCTPTLAAGVNLPARRVVVLRGYLGISSNTLTPTRYHQMAGRAGRAGYQALGDAFLIECPRVSEEFLKSLAAGRPDVARSQLDVSRAVVELVASGCPPETVLASFKRPGESDLARALSFAVSRGLIAEVPGGCWLPTPLGRCLGAAGADLERGLRLKAELEAMQRVLFVEADLQACFACAPADQVYPGRPQRCLGMARRLEALDPAILLALSLDPAYCHMRAHGQGMYVQAKEVGYQRLVIACALQGLARGLAIEDVATEVGASPGRLEAARAGAVYRAEASSAMCRHLGWSVVARVFDMLKERLVHGGDAEVVALLRSPGLSAPEARKMAEAGMWEPADVARASASVVASALGVREECARVATLQADALVACVAGDDLDDLDDAPDAGHVAVTKSLKRPRADALDLTWESGKRQTVPAQSASRVLRAAWARGAIVVSPCVKEVRRVLDPLGLSADCIRDTNLALLHAGLREQSHVSAREAVRAAASLPAQTPGELLDLAAQEVLMGAETRGFAVLAGVLAARKEALQAELAECERVIHGYAGDIQIQSPKQVGDFLFDALGLPSDPKRSTADRVLQELEALHPAVPAIRRYRTLRELLDGCALLAHADIVRPVFCMVSSATGRVVTEKPNLQCLPKSLRSCLAAPREGHVLVCADFRHVELRLLAHFSGDAGLSAALADPARDPFAEMASALNVSRESCKVVVYCIVYGAGNRSIAKKLGLPQEEDAMRIRDAFFGAYPVLRAWILEFEEATRASGRVEALGGRVRLFAPDAPSRQFVNTLCQASCSHLLKKALVRVDAEFPGALLLCVHDELVLGVPAGAAPAVAARVAQLMGSVERLRVPLPVSTRISQTWGL